MIELAPLSLLQGQRCDCPQWAPLPAAGRGSLAQDFGWSPAASAALLETGWLPLAAGPLDVAQVQALAPLGASQLLLLRWSWQARGLGPADRLCLQFRLAGWPAELTPPTTLLLPSPDGSGACLQTLWLPSPQPPRWEDLLRTGSWRALGQLLRPERVRMLLDLQVLGALEAAAPALSRAPAAAPLAPALPRGREEPPLASSPDPSLVPPPAQPAQELRWDDDEEYTPLRSPTMDTLRSLTPEPAADERSLFDALDDLEDEVATIDPASEPSVADLEALVGLDGPAPGSDPLLGFRRTPLNSAGASPAAPSLAGELQSLLAPVAATAAASAARRAAPSPAAGSRGSSSPAPAGGEAPWSGQERRADPELRSVEDELDAVLDSGSPSAEVERWLDRQAD